ncbi:MAG: hypothetical protein ACPGD5_00580 [Salibacteraceae bacterium]
MAGEGFASYANTLLKNNRGLLKKKTTFYLRQEYLKSAEKKRLKLSQVTPEQLAEIRAEILAANRKTRRRKMISLSVAIVITAILLYGATQGIKAMFKYSKHSIPDPIVNKH